jgi:hypothetical protein
VRGCRTGDFLSESLCAECEGWHLWPSDAETRSRTAAVEWRWYGLAAGTAVDGRVKPSRKAKMSRQTKHIPTRGHAFEMGLEAFGVNNNNNDNDCNVPCRHRRIRRAISGSNNSKHGADARTWLCRAMIVAMRASLVQRKAGREAEEEQ